MQIKQRLVTQTNLSAYELLDLSRDHAMRLVMQQIELFKNCRTTLITGESGVGKEMVARAIHERGERADRPFVILDCTNFDKNVIRSELFGHEKGSFTDAVMQKIGLVESAHGGTVFLDEIGEIPIELQPQLLRVIELGTFRRLGGSVELKSDFNLIAASNRNLEEAVRERRFRKDLFFRLDVFSIEVPPLRKRRDDILRLAKSFVDYFGASEKELSTDAEKLIAKHSWPGNVRELMHATLRAVVNSKSKKVITPNDFEIRSVECDEFSYNKPDSLLDLPIEKFFEALVLRIENLQPADFKKVALTASVLERAALRLALIERNRDISQISADLGINEGVLSDKISKLGL